MLGPNGGGNLQEKHASTWGILPKSVSYLFEQLKSRVMNEGIKYQVKVSYMQIYNEIINDLLRERIILDDLDDPDSQHSGLKIREYSEIQADTRSGGSNKKHEIFVSGLSEFRADNADDVYKLLLLGSNNRSTRSTECNASSSRSHAILQLSFEIEKQIGDGQTVINHSKLNFVDLAGSEKIISLGDDKDPKHLKELTSINKSLSSLGNVIASLAKGRPHIPYRDSKLTRLLQDSLSGNTRTLLIACVAPTSAHAAETFNTLQFADRASSVMVRVRPNVVIDDKALLVRAQVEVARLKRLLRFVMNGNTDKGNMEGIGPNSSLLGTEHTAKHSAVIEAMAVGANAGRTGGGDDEAAADSEMIRLLDENERLRQENIALGRKCNKLQARLNIFQGNSNSQAGVWSPVKGPSTSHRKQNRHRTLGSSKSRGSRSNPYIAHVKQGSTNNSEDIGKKKPSTGPADVSRTQRKTVDNTRSDVPEMKAPEISITAPEALSPSHGLYGGSISNSVDVSHQEPMSREQNVLSPVRGVIRKKSKSRIGVNFPVELTDDTPDSLRLTAKNSKSNLEKPRSTVTPSRHSGPRNAYADLVPVLRSSEQISHPKSRKSKKKSFPTSSDSVRSFKEKERTTRISQVRASSEW